MALVDLELQVKPWLEIPASETGSDDVLRLCMESATIFFESYCGRALEQQDRTQQFNGSGSHVLQLQEFPVTQINRVSIDSTWQFPTSIDTSTLLVDNDLFLVRREVWPQGIRNIQVAYTAGYAHSCMPTDLVQACLLMVEFLYHGRSDHRLGVGNRNKMGETLTYQDSVPKVILDLLAPYVRETAVRGLLRRAGGG